MAPYLDDTSSPTAAARVESAPRPAAAEDDLDDLFDYDVGLDDVFRDLEPPKPTSSTNKSRKDQEAPGLGIDKEVEVIKKQRAPRVKLDENRLLSQAGIPRLRRKVKDLKFKGKGHEYSDAARLLSFYQLWLDDLFPKAKFLDALAMVEKLGHKKRVQLMRMDWINEGKPENPVHEASVFDEPLLLPRGESDQNHRPARVASIFEPREVERAKTPELNADIEEDIYDATPRVLRRQAGEPSMSGETRTSIFGSKEADVSSEPEDDLDALLAEQEMDGVNSESGQDLTVQDKNVSMSDHNFDDEMDAMAEMEGMY